MTAKPNTNPNKTDETAFNVFECAVREWLKDINPTDWQHILIQVEHDISAKLDALITGSKHHGR